MYVRLVFVGLTVARLIKKNRATPLAARENFVLHYPTEDDRNVEFT